MSRTAPKALKLRPLARRYQRHYNQTEKAIEHAATRLTRLSRAGRRLPGLSQFNFDKETSLRDTSYGPLCELTRHMTEQLVKTAITQFAPPGRKQVGKEEVLDDYNGYLEPGKFNALEICADLQRRFGALPHMGPQFRRAARTLIQSLSITPQHVAKNFYDMSELPLPIHTQRQGKRQRLDPASRKHLQQVLEALQLFGLWNNQMECNTRLSPRLQVGYTESNFCTANVISYKVKSDQVQIQVSSDETCEELAAFIRTFVPNFAKRGRGTPDRSQVRAAKRAVTQ